MRFNGVQGPFRTQDGRDLGLGTFGGSRDVGLVKC